MVSQEDQIHFTVFNCVTFIYKVLKPRNRCILTSSLDLGITLTVLFGVRSLNRSVLLLSDFRGVILLSVIGV